MLKHSARRNSQPSRLNVFFKGRKNSSASKPAVKDEKSKELSKAENKVKHPMTEEANKGNLPLQTNEAEYLIVLHRILQDQVINTTEIYSIAGQAIKVEVLEDTEL